MANIIYEDYPYINGERKNEELNKKIISLAKRNKFYFKNIKAILDHNYDSLQICVAKQMNKKNDAYKIVGFIIYNGETLWARQRLLMTLKYWLVDEKMRNQGIGKELYKKMENVATEWGISNYAVMYEKTNKRLEQFYTNLGYKFIPKYDGVENTTNNESSKHLLVYKIVYTAYNMASIGGNMLVLIETNNEQSNKQE